MKTRLIKKQKHYISLLKNQINKTPSDAASYWHMAVSLKILGKNKEALDSINKAISLAPKNKIPLLFKARFCIADKDYDGAIKLLNEALDIAGSKHWNPTANNLLAVAYMGKGDFETAKFKLLDTLKEQDSHISALINIALCHLELKENELCCKALEKAASLFPGFLNLSKLSKAKNPFALQRDVSDLFLSRYSSDIQRIYKNYI